MSRKVLHRQIFKPSVFGGTVNTTLCGRVNNSASDLNVADSNEDVTCSFCRKILDEQPNHFNMKWLDYNPV